jgi:hypothetical protein
MKDNSALSMFPRKHLKPYDGMSVTADVWALAHGEHRQSRQAHDLFFHGAGIITGLEVLANDPPDRYVFISPGVAVDQAGKVIVLAEPVTYDFGSSTEGTLFLMLGYGEREAGGVEKEEKFIHDEFVIAARPSLPKRPAVELARITLNKAGRPIQNAERAEHPQASELDLRFRTIITPAARQVVRVGLVNLGKPVAEAASGWNYLASACQQMSSYTLAVDIDLTLNADLSQYDLVCLSGSGTFKLDASQQKLLREYLQNNKIIFIDAFDNAADASFNAVFEKLEHVLAPLAADDVLLSEPFLFSTPPHGHNEAQVLRDRQIIYSRAGYSLAWAAKLPAEQNTRADIRSAHEWGVNIIHYCQNHSG